MSKKKRITFPEKSPAYSPREGRGKHLASGGILDQCGDWQEGTHGFHAYPGRMHPQIPAQILAGRKQEDGSILDPFLPAVRNW